MSKSQKRRHVSKRVSVEKVIHKNEVYGLVKQILADSVFDMRDTMGLVRFMPGYNVASAPQITLSLYTAVVLDKIERTFGKQPNEL